MSRIGKKVLLREYKPQIQSDLCEWSVSPLIFRHRRVSAVDSFVRLSRLVLKIHQLLN